MNRAADAPVTTEQLFREHAAFVARFLHRLGVPSAAVDDLVQEAFMVVHRQGGYRPGPAAPPTYLAGVAARVAANHRRRERTRLGLLRRLWASPGGEAQATPVHTLEAQEAQHALVRALDVLSADERAVLVMGDFEHLPCAEIAAALSIPIGTVYFRLHTARERWIKAFERSQRATPAPRRPRPERSR